MSEFSDDTTTRRASGHMRRWLVAGGLAVALMIGAIGGGALALAHANAGDAGNVSASALGRGHHHGRLGHRGALTVTSVNGQTITATRPDGTKVTIHTTSNTVYTRAGQTVTASALATGEHIGVRGTRTSDGSIAATRIAILLPGYHGAVTKVNGDTITIQDRSGTHTIVVTASTRFVQGFGPSAHSASLGDVKVGDRIAAEGTLNSDGSLSAVVVRIGLAAPAHGPNDAPPVSTATQS